MSRPSRLLTALAALALLAASGCSDDEPEAAPETTTETSPAATPTPTPEPTPTEEPSEPLDPLDWESARHHGQPLELTRVGDGFFGEETQAVARLDATGQVVWRSPGPNTDDYRAFVVDGVPVAVPRKGKESDATYQPHLVQGLDPRTGKVRWTREATSSYTFSDGEHVVAPTCSGETTGALGDCTLTAYDPETGDVVWSRATYANVEQTQPGDGYTLVQTFPIGSAPRFLVLLPDGSVRATIDLPDDSRILSPVGDVLVADGPYELKAGSGCRQVVTAYDLDGAVMWRRTFTVVDQETRKKKCDTYAAIPVDAGITLLSTTRPPMLLDPETGRTTWKGTIEGANVYASSGRVLLVEDTPNLRTVGVDRRTGEELWVREGSTGYWKTQGGYASANYSCDVEPDGTCAVVLDARTGTELLNVPGVPQGYIDGRGDAGLGLLTRIDKRGYSATYGYVTLPPLT